jgi:hypothetical protein
MRPITYLSLAALSLVFLADAGAQRRPRYGGTLRLEVSTDLASPDESAPWYSSIFETLVRLDEAGRPEPHLAVSWSRDAARRRWVFVPRNGVRLHDGTLWLPKPESLTFADDRPIEELLLDLALPRNAIMVKQPQALPAGTGPYRIAAWEPGKTLTLGANEAHWAGRPFLDTVSIQLNRSLRDQTIAFELNRADVIELPLSDVRRFRGPALALSPPALLMALVASRPVPGLGSAIDRASIHSVLLQKQGEPTAALLPQNLSGLAFLHSTARDLAAARAQAAGTPPLSFSYDRQNPLLRSIAERITLNASEAGIVLKPSTGPAAELRLETVRITSPSPRTALADLAAAVNLPRPTAPDIYTAERALLDTGRIVPLFHLPAAHRVSSRVRGWRASEPWPLADIWLDDSAAR